MSNRRGEPWETSVPKIMAGVVGTRGMTMILSISSNEFNPPS